MKYPYLDCENSRRNGSKLKLWVTAGFESNKAVLDVMKKIKEKT